jgi:hypothetical protein
MKRKLNDYEGKCIILYHMGHMGVTCYRYCVFIAKMPTGVSWSEAEVDGLVYFRHRARKKKSLLTFPYYGHSSLTG